MIAALKASGNLVQEDAMFSTRVRAALAVSFLLAFSAVVAGAHMHSNMADADSAAIKQSVAAFSDSWNPHDPHAVAVCFSEDGDFSSTPRMPRHGATERN